MKGQNKMDFSNLTINFLGDSITVGIGAKDNFGYVDYIEKLSGAKCNNYGFNGSRIAKQKVLIEGECIDRNFCVRVDSMVDADIVFVLGGVNDYGGGDAPLGKITDNTNDTFYGALHVLYSSLIEKYHNSMIVIVTPLHVTDENNLKGFGGKKTTDMYTLKTYVDAIREVAEWYSLPVLDLYKSCGLNPNLKIIKEEYIPDGCHPNDKGYQRIAAMIIKYIENNYYFGDEFNA